MPCGKKPLVKSWDKPRNIRVVKPSRYQANEASVKVHWQNVIKEIELSCQDEQFWETQGATVRELVGPMIFERLGKIFDLEVVSEPYIPQSEPSTVQLSDDFYNTQQRDLFSEIQRSMQMSVFSSDEDETIEESEGEDDDWSVSSARTIPEKGSKSNVNVQVSRSGLLEGAVQSEIRSLTRIMSKTTSRTFNKSFGSRYTLISESEESAASSGDDMQVAISTFYAGRRRRTNNPHFGLLYCTESETDMIHWKSKYKQKSFQISASDEFSKKAELLTKQIAHDFFDWWVGLGSQDFKSEIRRPEEIESLFQVWFDEHASRGLVLDPKVLPCVLQTVADAVGAPRAACPHALKRQIRWDVRAETMPAHTMAFNSCLPQHLKHIPPRNNTSEVWHAVRIPEDLKSMAAIWEDIAHLTSTKAFHAWLQQRPHLPMPPYLKSLEEPGERKHPFVVPSDYVMKHKGGDVSEQELAIPVSQFSLEIKEVLSKLMNE